jgi:O-antigen/teichoic acid export membrane protein
MWILGLSDRMMLACFVPLKDLGIYNLAYSLGMVVHLLGTGIAFAYGPMYYKGASDPSFRKLLPRLLATVALVTAWMSLTISLLAADLLRVMSHASYSGAAALVPWVAIGYWCFVAIYQPCLTVIDAHRKTEWTLLISGVPALINLGLNWILIPYYGVYAAAGTTILAFFLMAAFASIVANKFDRLPFPWRAIGKILIIACGTYIAADYLLTSGPMAMSVSLKTVVLVVAGAVMAEVSGFRLAMVVGDVVQRIRHVAPATR